MSIDDARRYSIRFPDNVRIGNGNAHFQTALRSAELNSAVSQNCILQSVGVLTALDYTTVCRVQLGDTAECNSALRRRLTPWETSSTSRWTWPTSPRSR